MVYLVIYHSLCSVWWDKKWDRNENICPKWDKTVPLPPVYPWGPLYVLWMPILWS